MTPAAIIYQRRVQVLDRAAQTSVTEACRTSAARGLPITAGPVVPNALGWLRCCQGPPPTGDADRDPTRPGPGGAGRGGRPADLGARQLVDHLTDRGVRLSPSGVQKLLVRHRLGRRTQRVAALAQLTAATTGILTKDANHGPVAHVPGGMHRGTPGLGSIGRSRRYRLASLVAFWEAVTQAA